MELFNTEPERDKNLLPYEGTAHYYGKLYPQAAADRYYQYLLDHIAWQQDEAIIFGKHILTKRKVAWYGDRDFSYTYSNITKYALPWTPELLQLKEVAEKACGEQFNSCLLNLYHNGTESMAWHSDGERELKKNGAIGSLSFGAERKFSFKHKRSGEKVSIILEHGCLLVMKGETQTHWLHRLPPAKKIHTPRINLTFRMMNE